MKFPRSLRMIWSSSPASQPGSPALQGRKSSCSVMLNGTVPPVWIPSSRSESPRSAKASSRMWSIRAALFMSLATVKSHAR